ncbi:hypothetical protein [Methylobacterium sp. Leaf117]|uniref:hypothetical protein n=1 Tax=Methylobacterium sp. Leaf117 TaxID=1736260 RepID=UPI0006F507A5|nr:hypothetical protein [Methylobacterium sp. Leaf117]KQP77488.1 hypothetical protein ASF57_19500 [Methylobacterium sp. Leaf117]
MANPMSPEQPNPTFPDPSPAHPPQPDHNPLPEPRGVPDYGPDEMLPSNEPLGIPSGAPPEIG